MNMDNNFKLKIGQRIKQLREIKGYSQEVLGNLIDIDAPSLSRIENGRYAPSLYTFVKIVKALEISPDDFFECGHIMEDEELEKEISERVKQLSSNERQFVFRMIKYMQETNHK